MYVKFEFVFQLYRAKAAVPPRKRVEENLVKEEIKKMDEKEVETQPMDKGKEFVDKQPIDARRESLSDRKPPARSTRRSRGSPPDFILKPRSRSVFEGSNARFTCTVNGDPEPIMEWYFEGELFVPDKRRELKVRNGIATLVIGDACAEDIGDYKVVAKNELGEISHTATLMIDGLKKPERKKKEEPVR